MTSTQIGDEFGPESYGLSAVARCLHIDALCWSNNLGRDQLIPKHELARLNYTTEAGDPQVLSDAVAELIAAGWWEDRGGHVWIGCRFPHWQRTAAQVRHQREYEATKKRRHRSHAIGDHTFCTPKTCPVVEASESSEPPSPTAYPNPTQPNPEPTGLPAGLPPGVPRGVPGGRPSW